MSLANNQDTLSKITGLEYKLASVLKPVRPDPEYVNRLRHSLGSVPTAVLERRPTADSALMVILGLVAGVTVFYLIRKLFD